MMVRSLLSVCAAVFAGMLPMPETAQRPSWNGYYRSANLGGRFAIDDRTTSAARPNVGLGEGGMVGPGYARHFNTAWTARRRQRVQQGGG